MLIAFTVMLAVATLLTLTLTLGEYAYPTRPHDHGAPLGGSVPAE